MNIGKVNRLRKILRKNGRAIIVPIDHGLTLGPVQGLDKLENFLTEISQSNIDAFLAQKGVIQSGLFRGDAAQIVHISGATFRSGRPEKKVLVGRVEDALRLGADAVSVHVSIGLNDEGEMLRDLGSVSSQCNAWGIPLLAMMYVSEASMASNPGGISHIARIAAELGADLVKVPYTGSPESFQEVVDGCFIPVLAAGGEHSGDERSFFFQVRDALQAGAAGFCVGRNVFQNKNPKAFLNALENIVHCGLTPEHAYEIFLNSTRGNTSTNKSKLELLNER